MQLNDRIQSLTLARAADLAWAERKYESYYQRYQSDPEVASHLRDITLEVVDRLGARSSGPLASPELLELAGNLAKSLIQGTLDPQELRQRLGVGPELILMLHRLTGGHRELYLSLVHSLPVQNQYSPSYITMGPTGKCNVVCPDCIIGGAIFEKERQQLHKTDDVLPFLAQAEQHGVDKISFCIGEPTYNIPMLYRVFDQIRESPTLTARSMVTNALFARKYERALRFIEGFAEHLGPDKARQCMIGVSLNDPLKEVGVPVSATANLIQAFGEVLPGHRMAMQLIMDQDYHVIQNELYRELASRGLLAELKPWLLDSEGNHQKLELSDGTTVLISVMRKQPSLHNAFATPGHDPWVRYYTHEALTEVPLRGLYTYEDDEDPDEGGMVVHRITLAPDGVLFPDYHFMVAGTRPLGTTIKSASDSFRRDPLLGLLLQRGGLNVLLSTYMSIPADQRILSDIYQPALNCSTTGMVGANVIFGDYEVALQLLNQLIHHGITTPDELFQRGQQATDSA